MVAVRRRGLCRAGERCPLGLMEKSAQRAPLTGLATWVLREGERGSIGCGIAVEGMRRDAIFVIRK